MVWLALYLLAVPATYWLTGHVTVFQMVASDDRAAVSVVWPFTWLAAFCAALLIGTAMVHEKIVRGSPGESPDGVS